MQRKAEYFRREITTAGITIISSYLHHVVLLILHLYDFMPDKPLLILFQKYLEHCQLFVF